MKSSIRMLKRPTSFVLASFRPSTLKRSFSEVGSSGGAFSFAKIYSKGERPTRSAVCISSVLHSLRPCWMALLSILWGNFTLSWMCTPSKFCRVNTTSWQPPLSTLLRFAALVVVEIQGVRLALHLLMADRTRVSEQREVVIRLVRVLAEKKREASVGGRQRQEGRLRIERESDQGEARQPR